MQLSIIRLFAFCLLFVAALTWSQDEQTARGVNLQNLSTNLDRRFDGPAQAQSERAKVSIQDVYNEAPAGAENIQFVLSKVEVRGNTVYALDDLAIFFNSLLGQTITLVQAYDIAGEITAMYGNDGYVLSRAIVPAQTIDEGVFKIQIIEGYIDAVRIEGLDGQRQSIFDYYAKQLTESKPLKLDVLERYQLLANDIAGLEFDSVLVASELNPGAATLKMAAKKQTFEAAFFLDNRGSEYSGPWQLLVSGTVNDALNLLDSTRLRLATVPDSSEELAYAQLTSTHLLSAEGLSLIVDMNASRMKPDSELFRALELVTRGHSLSGTLSYPWIRSRQENLTLEGTFQYRDYESRQLSSVSPDTLYLLKLGARYDRADLFLGGGINLISLTYVQGLDMGSANINSRASAQPDFSKWEVWLQRNQYLSDSFSLNLRVSGQYANETLPSAEEFGLGGEYSVRGYNPSEWTGEKAYTGSLELRYTAPLMGVSTQWYAFYDTGKVFRALPSFGQNANDMAHANGVGVRVNISPQIATSVEVANPLDMGANNEIPDTQFYARLFVRY